MIADTTFLIDLEREQRRGRPGPASTWARSHAGEKLKIAWVTAGEFLSGFSDPRRQEAEEALETYLILEADEAVRWNWSRLHRWTMQKGSLRGENDLWIAALARSQGEVILSRDRAAFAGLPGVDWEDYSKG
jgi:predicted nucleic acid-binding protein